MPWTSSGGPVSLFTLLETLTKSSEMTLRLGLNWAMPTFHPWHLSLKMTVSIVDNTLFHM